MVMVECLLLDRWRDHRVHEVAQALGMALAAYGDSPKVRSDERVRALMSAVRSTGAKFSGATYT